MKGHASTVHACALATGGPPGGFQNGVTTSPGKPSTSTTATGAPDLAKDLSTKGKELLGKAQVMLSSSKANKGQRVASKIGWKKVLGEMASHLGVNPTVRKVFKVQWFDTKLL